MHREKYIQERISFLAKLLNSLQGQPLRKLTDLSELNNCGVYFIYDGDGNIVYIGVTDRPLSERLVELREYPKDHTFHSKLFRDALEKKLNRRIKKYDAKKLTKFQGHEIISIQEFKELLEDTKITIRNTFKYKAVEFAKEDMKDAISFEHFAISIYSPFWNDKVERLKSNIAPVEIF